MRQVFGEDITTSLPRSVLRRDLLRGLGLLGVALHVQIDGRSGQRAVRVTRQELEREHSRILALEGVANLPQLPVTVPVKHRVQLRHRGQLVVAEAVVPVQKRQPAWHDRHHEVIPNLLNLLALCFLLVQGASRRRGLVILDQACVSPLHFHAEGDLHAANRRLRTATELERLTGRARQLHHLVREAFRAQALQVAPQPAIPTH